jgi:hypothetical protein
MAKYRVVLIGPVCEWEDVEAEDEEEAIGKVAARADYRFAADCTDPPHRLVAIEEPEEPEELAFEDVRGPVPAGGGA